MKSFSLRLLLTFSLLVYLVAVQASPADTDDTLQMARELAWKKQFTAAARLLDVYNRHHHQPEALLLHAQVLYWNEETGGAEEIYQRAIQLFPAWYPLQSEYASMLFELGRYREAKTMLQRVVDKDQMNTKARFQLAQLNYWQNNTNVARRLLNTILETDPGYQGAASLLRQIEQYNLPALSAAFDYQSDDQPLKAGRTALVYTAAVSSLWSPLLSLSYSGVDVNARTGKFYGVEAGNVFTLNYGKTRLKLQAGVCGPRDTAVFVTGGMELKQRVSQIFSADAFLRQEVYQHTAASIVHPFVYQLAGVAVNFNRGDKWLGRAGYETRFFKDDDQLQSAYAWMLAPVLSGDELMLQAGYAFYFADSRSNRFIPKTAVTPANIDHEVAGHYDPYFTPQNQSVHMAMISARVHAGAALQFFLKASYGFSAAVDNTALIVQQPVNGEASVTAYYYRHRYHPVEAETGFSWRPAGRFSILADYSYHSLFFYKRHEASLQLIYRLNHGRRD
ncbi:MAG TPA: tetratricopeptide repeat protein [Chitinophagaceae bacterium]